jgi:lipoprotein-anchoring transpeptidase ErfK/SrfK
MIRQFVGALALLVGTALGPGAVLFGQPVSSSDSVRTDSSRKATADSVAGTVTPAAPAAPASGGLARRRLDRPITLRASLSLRELYIEQDGQVLQTYPVAIGKDEHPTPAGSYEISRVVWNPGWVPPDSKWARGKKARAPGDPKNPMKVVKIFFREPDYYIHGTGDTASLGTAASHGCLRMDPAQAAEVGAIVMEHGGSAFGWDWIKRLLHIGETRAVRLKQPVTLRVEH